MREFDTNGLRLAEYQGKLFELSYDALDCSTNIFMRRFYHSELLQRIDKNNAALLTLDPIEGIDDLNRQFGPTSYGKVKRSKESLFWVGYFYRYISYTREMRTRLLMQLFDYKKLFELYYVYHTQDMEWCIASLLELYGYTEDIFDPNYRLKQAMRKGMKKQTE